MLISQAKVVDCPFGLTYSGHDPQPIRRCTAAPVAFYGRLFDPSLLLIEYPVWQPVWHTVSIAFWQHVWRPVCHCPSCNPFGTQFFDYPFGSPFGTQFSTARLVAYLAPCLTARLAARLAAFGYSSYVCHGCWKQLIKGGAQPGEILCKPGMPTPLTICTPLLCMTTPPIVPLLTGACPNKTMVSALHVRIPAYSALYCGASHLLRPPV